MDEKFCEVRPQEMLNAKEYRSARQQALLTLGGNCVISFTLNIAGPVKLSPIIRKTFYEGLWQIENKLKRQCVEVLQKECRIEKTGCEAFLSVEYEGMKTKRIMIAIEDGHFLGRLFDIDVIDKNNTPVSRSQLGLPFRQCLVCERSAHECIRSQRHELVSLQRETERLMEEYFLGRRADLVAATACRSMLYEVCTTPKPGLVDRKNSGTRRDIDIFTFVDSVAMLTPHFRRLFLLGSILKDVKPKNLLNRLRSGGMIAEDDMLSMTKQINTHKGIIFYLGIVCAALGWSEANQRSYDEDSLLFLCGEIASPSIANDLKNINLETASTAGERLYVMTGNAGVRSEAVAGFPSVLFCGLPIMRRMVAEGKSLNDAGVHTTGFDRTGNRY